MADHGKQFGRDLADRMATRMRLLRLRPERITFIAATEVAQRANEMVRSGKSREEVARWIEQVTIGFSERLNEVMSPKPGVQ